MLEAPGSCGLTGPRPWGPVKRELEPGVEERRGTRSGSTGTVKRANGEYFISKGRVAARGGGPLRCGWGPGWAGQPGCFPVGLARAFS